MSSTEKIIARGVSNDELEKAKEQLLVFSREQLSTLVGVISDLAAGVPIASTRPDEGGFENLLTSLSAYSLTQLFQLKSGVDNLLLNFKSVVVEEKDELKLNEFGLPVNWAEEKGVEFLNWLKDRVNKTGHLPSTRDIRDFLLSLEKEFRQFKPSGKFSTDFGFSNAGDYDYLLKTSEERLKIINPKNLSGFPVMIKARVKGFVPWSLIINKELWCMRMAGGHQTLKTILKRNEISPHEMIEILYGVSIVIPWRDPERSKKQQECLDWLMQEGALVEAK